MRRFASLALGIVLFSAVRCGAQPPAKEKQTTGDGALAEIRQEALNFQEAFNTGNASAVAAHWTEDGDYTDESGQVISGREAIENEYEQFFAAHPGQRIQILIDSLRLLSGDAAIEDGRAILDPPPVGPPAITRYTVVHVKVDGKWLMSTVRDIRIETPSANRRVADLEWLIGTWVAEEHGSRTESVCRWVANKSFVQRTYTVTHHDHTTTSGLQIIGFNPQNGQIQSWNFSPDGGIAVGVWSPIENGWSAEMHGTLADGKSTTAVNRLVRLDDNAYVWQSSQRTVNDIPLPDTDEVVLKRQTK